MTDTEKHYIVPESLLEAALYEVDFLIDYTEEQDAPDPLDDHAFDVRDELGEYVNGPLRMTAVNE